MRLQQCQQRLLRPEGVPQRQVRVIIKSAGLMHLIVRPAKLAVHITVCDRGKLAVIERRVERLFQIRIGGFHLNFPECLVPLPAGGGRDGFKVPSAHFRPQIFSRPFHAHRGQAQADCHLIPIFGLVVEMGFDIAAMRGQIRQIPAVQPDARRGKGPGEFRHKIIFL